MITINFFSIFITQEQVESPEPLKFEANYEAPKEYHEDFHEPSYEDSKPEAPGLNEPEPIKHLDTFRNRGKLDLSDVELPIIKKIPDSGAIQILKNRPEATSNENEVTTEDNKQKRKSQDTGANWENIKIDETDDLMRQASD